MVAGRNMGLTTDVIVIGAGAIGLAIALELRWRGVNVTIVTRSFAEAATQAAAGMLAPEAEGIAPGAMLNLCLRSRALYPAWVDKLEHLTGIHVGYWACGILAPMMTQVADRAAASWCDRSQIDQLQPGLGTEVVGGYWYPQDAQVNNRALAQALWAAAQSAGVELQEGITIAQVQSQNGRITGLQTAAGELLQADHYILATGAWSQALLPIPVVPRKGQMLSVRVPAGENLALKTVLFGEAIYLVPRQDGRIVIGATSENVGFLAGNTPFGLQQLLAEAIRLYPSLQHYPLQETWWGFRPATPDELPILGSSPYANLTLATGHYRNGILLTPITASLIADWVVDQQADPLLAAFSWSRFSPAVAAGTN